MRIARVRLADGSTAHGVVEGEEVRLLASPPPGGIEDWLEQGLLADAVATASNPLPIAEVTLLAPIARPPKFLGLGGNYRSHLEEIAHLGITAPETQIWFNKQRTCVAGPFEDCIIPRQSSAVDFEGELGVVIGARCRHVSPERAGEMIAGYLVCNDVSVRDIQMRSQTMTLGKSFDTHGPIGPWLVTPDEIPDCQDLRVRTFVNGELRQDGSTAEMRWSVAEQIACLSGIFTTGTPAGVGAAARPPRFLAAGDIVRIEIEGIGMIENRFVADSGAVA